MQVTWSHLLGQFVLFLYRETGEKMHDQRSKYCTSATSSKYRHTHTKYTDTSTVADFASKSASAVEFAISGAATINGLIVLPSVKVVTTLQ